MKIFFFREIENLEISMKIKSLFHLFFLISFVSIIVLVTTFQRFRSEYNTKIKQNISVIYLNEYSSNNQFVINNNIAQYSSYLIIDQNRITIEAFVYYNKKYFRNHEFGDKENFICVVKFLLHDEDVFEFEAVYTPKFYMNMNRKLVYDLDLRFFKKDYEENKDKELILKNIVVAVIWKPDYDEHLNDFTVSNKRRVFLPYSLIKYLIPSIIYTEFPRLKSLSLCVAFRFFHTH